MKKITSCVLLLLLSVVMVSAQKTIQHQVKGVVIDSTTLKPLSYATVLFADSSKTIKATFSESDGKFNFRHNQVGEYKVEIKMVGYATKVVPVEFTEAGGVVDIGEIFIGEGVQLGEVLVVAPLITTDIDRTTYNTASDPETPALTALEMMRKVPMLSVDGEDNIKLKDQDSYRILVNGKTNSMMSKNYKEVLRSMPAASIKKIEVITNPPAKYDAEGLSGIINIITERKTIDGYNGSISVRGDQFGAMSANGYINMALGKFNFDVQYSKSQYRRPESSSWSKTFNDLSETLHETRYNASSKSWGNNDNFGFNASYEIDTFNLISASGWGYIGSTKSDMLGYSEYYNKNGELMQGYTNQSLNNSKYGSISANIDWQKTYMKPDKTFTVSYRLDLNPGGGSYDSEIIGRDDTPLHYPDRFQRSDNNENGGEHTLQVDYFDPLTTKHNIEMGLKYVMRPNTSDSYNEKRDEAGDWIVDNSRRNDMDYTQHIASAYGGYVFKLKKFSAKAGLRAEFTINTGNVKMETETVSLFNRELNVVPYVNFSYKLDDSQNLRLGYTQRLSRPGIWYLNPYLNDLDPLNVSQGNPNLVSEVRNNIDLSYGAYTKKFNLSVSLSASLGNNGIEYVTTVRPDGSMYSTYLNCGINESYSAYVYGGVPFFEGKLRVNINAGVSYKNVRTSIPDSKLRNSGFTYSLGGSLNAQLWKNANFNFYASYYSGGVSLQSNSSDYFYCNASISQAFFSNKQLRLNLNIQQPFEEKRVYNYESFGTGYRSISESTQYVRRIGFSIQWNFGKTIDSVKKARRGISNDDKMGGGGGGQ